MINESLKPLIRQIKNVKDQSVKEALCDSLLEMCDELISRGRDGSKTRDANDSVRL
jgi:hypothetical protein